LNMTSYKTLTADDAISVLAIHACTYTQKTLGSRIMGGVTN